MQQKIDAAYYTADKSTQNRLAAYEQNCLQSLNATQKAIEQYGTEEFADITARLSALRAEFEERRRRVDAYRAEQYSAAKAHNDRIGEALKSEPLTEMEKKTALRQKSVERFIGLNLLSKLGIGLLLIGIVLLGRFAYTHMSDVLKGVLIYALGAVLIGGGELFRKKEKTVFSTALISGGVAVLYAATATSLFAFHLFDEQAAFLVCIAVTAIAIAISHQIKSWIVCAFATVGGYLPLVAAFMITFDATAAAAASKRYLPAAVLYFTLLSCVVYIMTDRKKWYAAQFIGYGFQMVAVGGVISCAEALHKLPDYADARALAVGFSVISYLIYLMMPAAKIFRKQALETCDLALLALNTVSGAVSVCVTLYHLFGTGTAGNRAVGFAFVVFTAVYALLAVFSDKQKSTSSPAAGALLYIGTLIFSMLIVPYLFGWKYAALAWAAQGALLAVVSIEKKIRVSEYAGLGCMALAFVPYLAEDIGYSPTSDYPPLSIITLCIILVSFWAYTVKGLSSEKKRLNYFAVFEILTALGTFGYACYLYNALMASPKILYKSEFSDIGFYLVFALIIAVCLRCGILKNKISLAVSDVAAVILAVATVVRLDGMCFMYDADRYFKDVSAGIGSLVINYILLFVVNITVILLFSKAVSHILNALNGGAWIYTVSVAALVLAMITAVLTEQYLLDFNSVIISGIYIVAACVLLVIGFKKNFSVVRLTGLIMILAAFAKLLFVDAAGKIESGWRIASYFIYGAMLIGISYIYQRFSKKIENQ